MIKASRDSSLIRKRHLDCCFASAPSIAFAVPQIFTRHPHFDQSMSWLTVACIMHVVEGKLAPKMLVDVDALQLLLAWHPRRHGPMEIL